MSTEIWKDIPGYEGKYMASSLGQIRSYPNKGNGGLQKLLKGGVGKFGYRSVQLYSGGIVKTFLVHRLIGITFLGLLNYQGRMCVCHKNDIPSDNRVENLFLGTDKDNATDMLHKNRHYYQGKFGKDHNRSKVVKQLSLSGEYINTYFSTLEAERSTGINSGNIRKCCLGTAKTTGGFKWEYITNK